MNETQHTARSGAGELRSSRIERSRWPAAPALARLAAACATIVLQACILGGNPDKECNQPPAVTLTADPGGPVTAGQAVRIVASWDAGMQSWVPSEVRLMRDGVQVAVQPTGSLVRGSLTYEWQVDLQTTGSFRWQATAWLPFGRDGACSMNSPGVTLEVRAAGPAITQPPESVTVREGQSATFQVVATGTSPLSYQWHRDGAAIAGAVGAAYTLPAVTLGDGGARFDVIVSNAAGPVRSGEATLTVEELTSPASLDRSFGDAGVAVTTLVGYDLFPHTLVNLPDGRHAIVGRAQAFGATEATKLVVAVYRSDGMPDTRVGAGGLIVRDVADWFADLAPTETFHGIALAEAPARSAVHHERNGVAGIVVGLQATTTGNHVPPPYHVLARFWLAGPATGELDLGFGDAGLVRRPSPSYPGARLTRGLAVDSTQRLYELWTTSFTTSAAQGSGASLLRWRADGTADPDWGSAGELVLNDPINAPGQRVEVLPDGRVLVVGIERVGASRHLIVTRLDADGRPDAGYGTAGTTRIERGVNFDRLNHWGTGLWDLQRDAEDRVLLGFPGMSDPLVLRLTRDGAFDAGWTANAGTSGDGGYLLERADCGLRILPDGRLLTVTSFNAGFIVRRRLADLSAEDPSFNRDDSIGGLAQGAAVYPFENSTSASFFCFATHLQADGRILIAGRAYGAVAGQPNGFGLVRLRGGDY